MKMDNCEQLIKHIDDIERGRLRGWLVFIGIVLALGIVGHIETTGARDVVCMPVIDEPLAPAEGTEAEARPATYRF